MYAYSIASIPFDTELPVWHISIMDLRNWAMVSDIEHFRTRKEAFVEEG